MYVRTGMYVRTSAAWNIWRIRLFCRHLTVLTRTDAVRSCRMNPMVLSHCEWIMLLLYVDTFLTTELHERVSSRAIRILSVNSDLTSMRVFTLSEGQGLVPAVLLLLTVLTEMNAFRPTSQGMTFTTRDVQSVWNQHRRNVHQLGLEGPSTAEKVAALRQKLLNLGARTDRGFRASKEDRKMARELIFNLSSYNAVREPARAYYQSQFEKQDCGSATIKGKWTLVYTDAPDITNLGQNLFAELGRIGQVCEPPYIKNVIEWKRPSWAATLPFSGTDSSRVIQKIVTKAKADPSSPAVVGLAIAGFQLETDCHEGSNGIQDAIQREGLIAGLLQNRGVDVNVWNAPFGTFEILYIDDDFRITKTGQNFFAVNTRVQDGEEWC